MRGEVEGWKMNEWSEDLGGMRRVEKAHGYVLHESGKFNVHTTGFGYPSRMQDSVCIWPLCIIRQFEDR